MTLAESVLGIMFIGLIAYGLFGGADFGAGIWDLLAGGTRRGSRQRDLIEHSIGPVWEANHVWLIFVLVVLWTAFSGAFAAVITTLGMRRFLGAGFALSSLVTPYFLGAVVGGVASGRVPPGIATGDVVTSWVNPTSVLGGVMAVLVCAYLSAVFLCADAKREGADDLVDEFRIRALGTAAVTGVVGLAGLFVLRSDAPLLWDGLTGRAAPVIGLSVVAGVAAVVGLVLRRYVVSRLASALAVTTILVGWAVSQYPYVLVPDVTIEEAATGRATLEAMLLALAVGAVVLVPSLVYLYVLFQRAPAPGAGPGPAETSGSTATAGM